MEAAIAVRLREGDVVLKARTDWLEVLMNNAKNLITVFQIISDDA